jgi:hypothetical protein
VVALAGHRPEVRAPLLTAASIVLTGLLSAAYCAGRLL